LIKYFFQKKTVKRNVKIKKKNLNKQKKNVILVFFIGNYKYSISIYALIGMYMRTTIELNDAIYKKIVSTNGKRNISNTINSILYRYLFKSKKKDMFGTDPWLKKVDTSDIRDEYDRNL